MTAARNDIPDEWIELFNDQHRARELDLRRAISLRIRFTDVPLPAKGYHLGLSVDPTGAAKLSHLAAPEVPVVSGSVADCLRLELGDLARLLVDHVGKPKGPIGIDATPAQAAAVVARLMGVDDWIARFNEEHRSKELDHQLAISLRIRFTDVPLPARGYHLGVTVDPRGAAKLSWEAETDVPTAVGPAASILGLELGNFQKLLDQVVKPMGDINIEISPYQMEGILAKVAGVAP